MHQCLVNQVLHVHEHLHIIDVKINLHKAGEHIIEEQNSILRERLANARII